MRSEQAIRDFIQSGLENLEARKPKNFSGLSLPLLLCPHGENESSYIQSGLLISALMLVVFCPVTLHHCGKPDSLLTSL